MCTTASGVRTCARLHRARRFRMGAHADLVIGQTWLTGPVASGVQENTDGAKLCLDWVTTGGINGQRVAPVVSQDDRFDPKVAAENARKLAPRERAKRVENSSVDRTARSQVRAKPPLSFSANPGYLPRACGGHSWLEALRQLGGGVGHRPVVNESRQAARGYCREDDPVNRRDPGVGGFGAVCTRATACRRGRSSR